MQERIRASSDQIQSDPETFAIIGAGMQVHRILGRGFLEPVYQSALELEFKARGICYHREVDLPVYYNDVELGVRYRVDFVCFGSVLVELKALERITSREESQLIHYLLASRLRRGLLLNFGGRSLQFKRFIGIAPLPESAVQKV